MEFLEIHTEGKKYFSELTILYKEAFPPEELKPWDLIERLYVEKKMEILAIVDDETFVGLAINMLYEDQALLDYFAIVSDKRERGYGSKAIRMLQKRFEGKTYILEIELPLPDSSNLIERSRRKAFYLRNGLKETKVYANVYETDFELLTPDGELTYEKYTSFLYNILGEWGIQLLKPQELTGIQL